MIEYSKQIKDLATAISKAEGFGILGAVPTRAHNPGDLKLSGYPVTGAEGIAIFPNDETGWEHLYSQLNRMATNASHVYRLTMTFKEFASKWTDTQQSNWLDNILGYLQNLDYNIDETTTLDEFFNERI